jgi:ribosomal 50S subunit-associated protein YjgA (DUF615 family)
MNEEEIYNTLTPEQKETVDNLIRWAATREFITPDSFIFARSYKDDNEVTVRIKANREQMIGLIFRCITAFLKQYPDTDFEDVIHVLRTLYYEERLEKEKEE